MKTNKLIFFVFLLATNISFVHVFELGVSYKQVLTIHAFLFSMFFLTNALQDKFAQKKPQQPIISLSVNFFRIVLCIIFLFLSFLQSKHTENTYIYNFFLIYFSMHFYDIFLRLKHKNKLNK